MGSTKTQTSSTQQATPTAAETEMQNLQLQQYKQLQPGQTQLQQQAMGMGSQLLGSFNDPNSQMWQSLIGGVTGEQQQRMISEQDRYLKPQLQAQGIYDSGLGATMRMRSATDLANQNAQFNVGALQNALNLALSGQAQVQAPTSQGTSLLAQQLAGLRTVTGTQTQKQQYDFFTSPFTNTLMQATGTAIGGAMSRGCWVAKEIFGSWEHPKTINARYYVLNIAPDWFRSFYIKHGEKIARFIHNKPIFKLFLRPLFEFFAFVGMKEVQYGY